MLPSAAKILEVTHAAFLPLSTIDLLASFVDTQDSALQVLPCLHSVANEWIVRVAKAIDNGAIEELPTTPMERDQAETKASEYATQPIAVYRLGPFEPGEAVNSLLKSLGIQVLASERASALRSLSQVNPVP